MTERGRLFPVAIKSLPGAVGMAPTPGTARPCGGILPDTFSAQPQPHISGLYVNFVEGQAREGGCRLSPKLCNGRAPRLSIPDHLLDFTATSLLPVAMLPDNTGCGSIIESAS